MQPLLDLVRRAGFEKALLPSMGLQALRPGQLDPLQPGLHFGRQPGLVTSPGPLGGCRDAGGLRRPIGPTCPAELADNAELLLFSVEVASNEAGAPADGPYLLQRQPDSLAELLLLPAVELAMPLTDAWQQPRAGQG